MNQTQNQKKIVTGKKQPKKKNLDRRLQLLEEKFAVLESPQGSQNLKFKALGDLFQKMAHDQAVIFGNQKDLAVSEERLDEQFCVLTRLTISRLNEIALIAHGEDADLITYDQVNLMFMEWAKFRQRPDFKDHMQTWMMGGDLNTLPPPPEPPKEEETPDAPGPKAEDAEEFGGDHGEGQESDVGDEIPAEEQPEDGTDSPQDSMSEGQDPDEAVCDEHRDEGSALP